MKFRRRLGKLLFGFVLMLLKEPLPMAHCGHCGRVTNALCTKHLAEIRTGQTRDRAHV